MELPMFIILTILSSVQCKVSENNLSCNEIRAFVDGHNDRRLLLAKGKVPGQPAASEMKKLVWDEELYDKATKWANRNEENEAVYPHEFSHSLDKSVPSGRFKTGENLYWYSTTARQYKLDPDKALEDWFSEHKDFKFGPLKVMQFSAAHPDIGHYTQMVWSDTTHVGCAISKTLLGRRQNFFVVCIYGPQGNYIRQTPYKTGAGASGRLICDHKDCSRPYGTQC